jgi:threonine/homoserine/homoserine lactone efflux protein
MIELFSELNWPAFLLAMVIVELTPGPNMVWIAALSAQYGRKIGYMAVLGITLGLAVQMLAAAAGLSTIFTHFPIAYQTLRWAGVLFMLWLAWEAYSEVGSSSPVKGLSSKGFTRGFIANILNPKALIFYVAVVGQFAKPSIGDLWWQILVLGCLHLFVAVIVHLGLVITGARFGQAFEAWRTSIGARLTFSVSLVGIAIWIAISTS